MKFSPVRKKARNHHPTTYYIVQLAEAIDIVVGHSLSS